MRHRHVAAIGALLAVTSPALLAQQRSGPAVFKGIVTANHGDVRVDDAELRFEEANRSVRTARDGSFVLDNLPAGTYRVNLRRPGFSPISGSVKLAPGDTVDWRFDMIPDRVELTKVEVTAPDSRVELKDFHRRQETTIGKFLTEKEIAATGGQNLGNIVIGRIPGFSVVQHPTGMGTALAARRYGGVGTCYSAVYINGDLFYSSEKSAMPTPPSLEDFNLQEIAAIEFYRASEVPPELQFRAGPCGVVMLWMQIRNRKKSDDDR